MRFCREKVPQGMFQQDRMMRDQMNRVLTTKIAKIMSIVTCTNINEQERGTMVNDT
jgi:hypothetical protein